MQSICEEIVLWTIDSNIFSDARLMSYVENWTDINIWYNSIESISHKTLYRSIPDIKKKNILYVPFYERSIQYTDIRWDILPIHIEYLRKKNFIVAFCYPREYVFPEEDYFKNLKLNNIFSINNSYSSQINPYQINVNFFDIHYKLNGNIKSHFEENTTSRAFEDKRYKMSAFFGELDHRKYRYELFCRLNESPFLDNSDVFYTFFRKASSTERRTRDNETLEDIYDDCREWGVFDEIKNSALNIVFETDPRHPYYTEKLLKPIIAGVPFIWQAHHNLKNVLTDMGYMHYPFIDYSFDSIEDPYMRTDALFHEISRLYEMDLNLLSKEFKHISKHNQDNFWSIDVEKELYDALSKTF